MTVPIRPLRGAPKNRRAARPGRGNPLPRLSSTDWMGAAACHDDGRDWTSPTVPRPSVVTNLALTCQFCPVAVDCGLYALHTDAEMGMYAGVWLPAHGYRTAKPRARWLAARAAITRRISHVS